MNNILNNLGGPNIIELDILKQSWGTSIFDDHNTEAILGTSVIILFCVNISNRDSWCIVIVLVVSLSSFTMLFIVAVAIIVVSYIFCGTHKYSISIYT